MSRVFGYAVFAVILGGMLRANAYRWRHLAKSYAAQAGPVLEQRRGRSAVLIGLGAFNSFKGLITIGLHDNGVSFRVMPIFSLFHEPLFVPYSDISGWRTTWYLDARSSELEFQRAPAVKMVLPAEDAEWIQGHAGQVMALRDERPPDGNVGRGWHAFTVASSLLSLAMLGVVAAYLMR